MNIEEFVKLYHQIMENNSWKHMLETYLEDTEKKPMIKYLQFIADTRDGEIYTIRLEPFTENSRIFRLDDPVQLKELKEYLKLE